jgi:hypothetical protein
MFQHSDPTGTGFLKKVAALSAYRELIQGTYRQFARRPASGFTLPDAFLEVTNNAQIQTATISWLAFPKSVPSNAEEIDRNRFRDQDEYVEWRTDRNAQNRVTRVTFTTEFPEYYEALAATDPTALLAEMKAVTGSNAITIAEVFGPGFDPAAGTRDGRASRLLQRAKQNPWNSSRSILFLSHPSSTLGALFNLAAACGVPNTDIGPSDACASVEGACVPSRNSDPSICTAIQALAVNANSFAFADPVGIAILELKGIWKLNGKQIDINASPLWKVERNGRRGTLEVPDGLTIVDNAIENGTEVAARLSVGATVQFAPDAVLPEWSRMGQESSRMPGD